MIVDKKAQIYTEHLQNINGLKNAKNFTPREIDVIACILNKKLNSQISILLSIGLDGIETHIRNIMIKIDCDTREEIVRFIKNSKKIQYIEEIYIYIKLEKGFLDQFQMIKRDFFRKKITCSIFGIKNDIKNNLILKKFLRHCEKLFGMTLKINPISLEAVDHSFHIFTHDQKDSGRNFLMFEFEDQEVIQHNIINFAKDNYFLSFLKVLELIIGKHHIEPYAQNCKTLYDEFQKELLVLHEEIRTQKLENKKLIKRQSVLLIFIVSCTIILTTIMLFLAGIERKPLRNVISPNLALPKNTLLLPRKELLEKINKVLSRQDGIKIAILSGAGGSGKTTLAYQYAKFYAKDTALIWEINAESRESILDSLQQLATALCVTQEEREELANICSITNSNKHTEKLRIFLGKKITRFSHWLIIYENVRAFNSLQWYFPVDVKAWGPGKVIINTADYNMVSNPLIPKDSIIDVGELTDKETLDLFSNILQDNKFDNSQTIEFLKHIPPFPLDIELAASFIKDQRISYDDYLTQLEKPTKEFTSIQEGILVDMGSHAKTRYSIIATSIEKLSANSDFRDLLLFISLLDAKHIPANLLIKFKRSRTVQQLINELKKYALISESNVNGILVFSVHRCTQQGILAYLNLSNISISAQLINPMVEILEKYMDQKYENHNTTESYIIASTAESFLKHNDLLAETQQAGIMVALGQYYSDFDTHDKATKYLTKALDIVKKYNKESVMLAKIERRLGILYKAKGDYKKSYELLTSAYNIYNDLFGDEQLLTIETKIDLAWMEGYLKNYEKAEITLKDALNFYQTNYTERRVKIAELQIYLGYIYNVLGKHDQAKKIIETGLATYQEILGKDHVFTAWAKIYLSMVYRDLSYYKQAKLLLDNALEVYKKYYGIEHTKVAYVLEEIGNLYLKEGNNVEAENFLNQSLTLYKLTNHGKGYSCMESLGNIYIKKSHNTTSINQKTEYKTKAQQYITKALELARAIFPEDSNPILNLLNKLQQIDQI